MSITDLAFDGSTSPGTVIIEANCVRFRARFDEDAEAREVYRALQWLMEERNSLEWQLRRVRESVARLSREVSP